MRQRAGVGMLRDRRRASQSDRARKRLGVIGTWRRRGRDVPSRPGPRSATVTAKTEMHLLVLSSRSFSALINQIPLVARRIMVALAGRVREAGPPAAGASPAIKCLVTRDGGLR